MTDEVAAIWYDPTYWRTISSHTDLRGKYTRIYVDDITFLLKCAFIATKDEGYINETTDYITVEWWRFWIDDYFSAHIVIEYVNSLVYPAKNFRIKSCYRAIDPSTTMDEIEHILTMSLLQKELYDGE